jgi:hypothetical protein
MTSYGGDQPETEAADRRGLLIGLRTMNNAGLVIPYLASA